MLYRSVLNLKNVVDYRQSGFEDLFSPDLWPAKPYAAGRVKNRMVAAGLSRHAGVEPDGSSTFRGLDACKQFARRYTGFLQPRLGSAGTQALRLRRKRLSRIG